MISSLSLRLNVQLVAESLIKCFCYIKSQFDLINTFIPEKHDKHQEGRAVYNLKNLKMDRAQYRLGALNCCLVVCVKFPH